MAEQRLPIIPETITVHLGPPDSDAPNVTVPFIDYIKNVASSEIYPTWPDNSLRANIITQITFALNRIYTEYYRSRGYPFDITNSTTIDQAYVDGRDIFDNISVLVDEIFNTYIVRGNNVEPLFALYCNGTTVTCNGLSQWGTVDLANQGLTPYEILTTYYGDDINLVRNSPVQGLEESYPGFPLRLNSTGNDVRSIQLKLNRISKNYPAIPKIPITDGTFGAETERAVKEFQKIFSLTQDGIVGRSTWYEINKIYGGVKKLTEINSEGIPPEDITALYDIDLGPEDTGAPVRELQYLLSFTSVFNNQLGTVPFTGIYGPETEEAVRAFQEYYGLPVTGRVDINTWKAIYDTYRGVISSLPEGYFSSTTEPYGGVPLRLGSEGADVVRIQDYLNYISNTYTEIPKIDVDGVFGAQTQAAVLAYQNLFGIEPTGIVAAFTYNSIAEKYNDLTDGTQGSTGQYTGQLSPGEG